MTKRHKQTIAASLLAGSVITTAIAMASPASADAFTLCPSGKSGVASADTSCAFADNVHRAWYSQPGTIVMAHSPVTNQVIRMQCTSVATNHWPVAKRCVGANASGAALIVYID